VSHPQLPARVYTLQQQKKFGKVIGQTYFSSSNSTFQGGFGMGELYSEGWSPPTQPDHIRKAFSFQEVFFTFLKLLCIYLFLLLCWGYTVAFTKVLATYQIYHT
jgi:hypothetical protein